MAESELDGPVQDQNDAENREQKESGEQAGDEAHGCGDSFGLGGGTADRGVLENEI